MTQFRNAHSLAAAMDGFRRSAIDYAGELAYYRGIARRLRVTDGGPRHVRH